MRKEIQELKRQWNDEILEKDAVNKTNEELRDKVKKVEGEKIVLNRSVEERSQRIGGKKYFFFLFYHSFFLSLSLFFFLIFLCKVNQHNCLTHLSSAFTPHFVLMLPIITRIRLLNIGVICTKSGTYSRIV